MVNTKSVTGTSQVNANYRGGPKTPEGKRRSSRNALKNGKHAQLLKNFVPPHAAVLCNQDRQAYYRAAEKFLAKYSPQDSTEEHIVLRLIGAEWRVELFNRVASGLWNKEILREYSEQKEHIPEVRELLVLLKASETVAGRSAFERFFCRLIKDQDRVIQSCEKRIIFLRRHFPAAGFSTSRKAIRQEENEFFTPDNELQAEWETSRNGPESITERKQAESTREAGSKADQPRSA